MPGGTGSGREVHRADVDLRIIVRLDDGVDPHVACEPVRRSFHRWLLWSDVHVVTPCRALWSTTGGGGPRSGAKQRLDGAAFVHGAIPLGNLCEGKCEVEDPAGVDLALPDELGELREEAPDRRRPAVKMGVAEEEFVPGQIAVCDADVADVPTGASGVDCLHHRLTRSDCLDDRLGAESVGEFPDPGSAIIAAFFDDVGRTELKGQL